MTTHAANPLVSAMLEIGDGYIVRFDFNSLCALEGATGRTIDKLQWRSFSDQRAIIWAGLLANHHMTIDEVGNLIGPIFRSDPDAYKLILDKVSECFKNAFPEAPEKGGKKTLPNAEATSDGSGN